MTPPAPSVSGPIVIAASGTGGHIYPGLALAEAICDISPHARVAFTGTRRGLEGELVATKAGYPLHYYDMVPLTNKSVGSVVKGAIALCKSVLQARKILRSEQAKVAISMGGYGGIPLIIGARLAGVPALIHESGAVAGRANVLSSRFVSTPIALSFASAAKDFGGRPTEVIGMPISGEMNGFDRDQIRPEARAAYGLAEHDKMVLIVGGSQGARTLNEVALQLAQRWASGPDAREHIKIVLKTGKKNEADVAAAIAAAGVVSNLTATAYLDRMDHAYAAADVIICRAGAGTVAEVAVAGLPAVFVPYPGAIDDHQALNAKPLVDAGAAVLVRDDAASAATIAAEVEPLLDDVSLHATWAAAARSLGRADAARELATRVLAAMSGSAT